MSVISKLVLLIVSTAILYSCGSSKKDSDGDNFDDIVIVATAAHPVDNSSYTLASIAKSIGIGVDMVSFKVYFTSDNVPVISRSPQILLPYGDEREKPISEVSYATLRRIYPINLQHSLTVLENQTPYPTIKHLVRMDSIFYQRYPAAVGKRVTYQIGLINQGSDEDPEEYPELAKRFIENTLTIIPMERISIYSDSPKLLRRLSDEYGQIPTGLETKKMRPDSYWEQMDFQPDMVRIRLEDIDQDDVDIMQNSKINVLVDHVSKPEQMRKAAQYGADGICTDAPSEAVALFGDQVSNPFIGQ